MLVYGVGGRLSEVELSRLANGLPILKCERTGIFHRQVLRITADIEIEIGLNDVCHVMRFR